MDTLGNILDTEVYYDPNGRDMLINSNYDLLTEPDGSFVGVGVFDDLERSNFLIRFNPDLSFHSISEYSNANAYFVAPIGLGYRGNSGYYLYGGKVITDTDYQGFIKTVGLDGIFGWNRSYGNSANDESIQGVFHRNDNTALVGKVIIERTFGANVDPESYTSFMTINKLGDVISEWLSPPYTEGGPFGVTQLGNGNLVYYTRQRALNTPVKKDFNLLLVCRDSNFQLKWEKVLSTEPKLYNGGYGLKQGTDGSWYCLGIEPIKLDGINEQFEVYVYKLSAEGDSIWRQYLELPSNIDPSMVVHYQPTGSLVLPSGSLLISGYIEWQNENGSLTNSGWLIKMSPDGCIEWSNCISGIEDLATVEEHNSLTIAPNPTNGSIEVGLPAPPAMEGRWQLNHLAGSTVRDGIWAQGARSQRFDMAGLPSGIYCLSVQWANGQRYWGKVVVVER